MNTTDTKKPPPPAPPSRQTTTPKIPPLLLLLTLLLSTPTTSFAVDRSKFRTCDQTSFCRRNRLSRSSPQYDYRLDVDSLTFWKPPPPPPANDPIPGDGGEAAAAPEDEGGGGKKGEGGEGGILASLGRMLYTKSPAENAGSGPVDPYVRGPPEPFVTGRILNVSPHRASGEGSEEALALSVYLLADGVARVRITEEYGGAESPYAKARWTSDELVLNEEEMGVDYESVERIEGGEVMQRLVGEIGGEKGAMEDYVAFRFGGSVFLIGFRPFGLHLWRDGADGGPPLVSVNAESLMHFEVRREKEAGVGKEGNSDVVRPDGDPEEEEEDRHGGKEITGYWEDGLAIYADGTREERREAPKPDSPSDAETTEQQRQLEQEQQSDYTPDTKDLWEETWSTHHDSKPHGPTSVGADISFPRSNHLYGLPEHAAGMKLRSTTGGEGSHYKEPYRLYNLDVFEYELDETMALYGEVPLVISQSKDAGTVGLFWFNPTETFVDVEIDESLLHNGAAPTAKTHWISESGILDLFFLPGPDPPTLYSQYARLTGRLALPPIFALGYHQCRWNYRDEEDVYAVHAKFEELDYPYDVLWLDIEHTDGKRYFTWDKGAFPHPVEMQDRLKAQGRNMVTIVDPHIKRDNNYYIHKEATSRGLYIKDKDGQKDYDGWCWPGSSSYLDFTSAHVRSWWAEQFSYDHYQGSTPSLYTWNDMNEPSVFNGPEVSMSKDLRNLDGVEHREWHNLYGVLFQRATAEGLVGRNEGGRERPFVLSRSFFAGSQKYGAIWTGDNESSWSHLKIATPMLLSLNTAALSFVGADVGGFFGNPDAELMTRWMQAGAYTPFFRGHAHHDSKRREPWVFGHEWMVRMRQAAMSRYALLPYWYSLFREAAVTGMPVMRAMWMQYPKIESLYGLDDQYLIGSDLLVKPITDAGAKQTHIMFPLVDTWYDVDTMKKVQLPPHSGDDIDSVAVRQDRKVTIDTIPVYQRGGSIIPRKLRLRRSTQTMTHDPYTLYMALDGDATASGELYVDDERSFDYEDKKHYGVARFSVDWKTVFRNEVSAGSDWAMDEGVQSGHMVERIVVMGVEREPKSLTLRSNPLDFDYDAETSILVIRQPLVSALSSWEIRIIS